MVILPGQKSQNLWICTLPGAKGLPWCWLLAVCVRHFGTSADMSGQFGSGAEVSVLGLKCPGSEVSWHHCNAFFWHLALGFQWDNAVPTLSYLTVWSPGVVIMLPVPQPLRRATCSFQLHFLIQLWVVTKQQRCRHVVQVNHQMAAVVTQLTQLHIHTAHHSLEIIIEIMTLSSNELINQSCLFLIKFHRQTCLEVEQFDWISLAMSRH